PALVHLGGHRAGGGRRAVPGRAGGGRAGRGTRGRLRGGVRPAGPPARTGPGGPRRGRRTAARRRLAGAARARPARRARTAGRARRVHTGAGDRGRRRRAAGRPGGVHGQAGRRGEGRRLLAARLRRTARPGGLPAGRPRHRGGAVVIAGLRHAFWRAALTATGGLRVDGTLPDRPCVLVANHTSHADTAALLAALPAARRPVVAAAADYWFTRPLRRATCRLLMGAFPVRRSGGGLGSLLAAGELLAQGRDVIVYPEGSRSRDGSLGEFRAGAARLAER